MTTLIERAAQLAAVGVDAVLASSDLNKDLRRPAALYLLVVGCNLPGATVAQAVGCTKQNVSKHLKRIEDAREDAAFDAKLADIETRLFGAP